MSEGLKSADWHERQRAVWALGDSKDHAGAVRALEAVLRNDPVRDVRASAATALGQLGGPEVTALLGEKTASTDESVVRVAALEAIATSRDPSAVPGLINLFRLNRDLRGHDVVVGHDDAVDGRTDELTDRPTPRHNSPSGKFSRHGKHAAPPGDAAPQPALHRASARSHILPSMTSRKHWDERHHVAFSSRGSGPLLIQEHYA